MIVISRRQRRWLVVFGLSLAVLIALASWSNARLKSYRDVPFDFDAMRSGDLFVTYGLTRRQAGSVKLGFAETHDAPEIGLYGNHIFQFFGEDAFGRARDPVYFFNYWYANLALPEIYRYLHHLEEIRRLPRKLILVQITSPNLDDGQFITNFGNELPPDLLLIGAGRERLPDAVVRFAGFAWQVVENRLHEVMNYGNFILGLLQGGYEDRVIDPAVCRAADRGSVPSGWLKSLPPLIRDPLSSSGAFRYCEQQQWTGAFRRDGSCDPDYADMQLVRDEDALLATGRGLNAGDESEIARQMRAIDSVGRRHGVKVVFIVPPAYESDRADSVVNQVFDRGLALVPELTVIDNRDMSRDASLFVDYRHPSPRYFRGLADELRRRGLLN